jgi:hypothetical protein
MRKTALGSISVALLALAAISYAAPPPGKGGGKGGGGSGEDPPAAIETSFVFTQTGKPATINVANSAFSETRTVADMSDGRTRGLDHAPDEGRVLTEEHRILYETRYSQNGDGSFSVIGREVLFNGELSADKVQCIATAAGGRTAYSLTSTTSNKIKIFTTGGTVQHFFQGPIESCDFERSGAFITGIVNLPGADFLIVRIDLPSGEPQEIFLADGQFIDLDEIDVAPDGQSYLISWQDRSLQVPVRKVSEWRPGEDLSSSPVIANEAMHGSYSCDVIDGEVVPVGFIYQSIAGRDPTWVEQIADGKRNLIASKGNTGVYWLRSTVC